MATNWGCAGAGLVSSDFFTAIKENLPSDEYEFVATAARDLSRSQKFADSLGFKKAYGCYDDLATDPDVEIVYIGTNHPNHAELSIKMMNAGKNVLCEKPMAMNLKQAKKVLAAAKQNNVFFMEGLWTMFLPAYQQIKKDLKENCLGNVRLVRSEMCLPALLANERFQTTETGGGAVFSFAGYSIALALMVYQDIPISITALANFTTKGVDETLCFSLKFKNGGMANVSSNLTVSGENTAVIFGDKANIKIESPMWTPTKVTTPSGLYEFPLKDGTYNYPNSAAFHFEAAAVRHYLKSGAKEALEVPHRLSEMIATIMDEVRKQIGYIIPEDKDD